MRALLESCSVALITKSEPVPKVVAITAVALCLLGVLASVRRLSVIRYVVYKTLVRGRILGRLCLCSSTDNA